MKYYKKEMCLATRIGEEFLSFSSIPSTGDIDAFPSRDREGAANKICSGKLSGWPLPHGRGSEMFRSVGKCDNLHRV